MIKTISIFILVIMLGMPCFAASDNNSSSADSIVQNKNEKGEAVTQKGDKAQDNAAKNEKKQDPNVFECQYYTVTLEPGWTAITPPIENQGTVTSVFKSNSGGVAVMLVLGKLGGADAKTVAEMFAEQFKAEKPPVAKNGQYTFTFLRDGKPCEAFITSQDDIFMVTTISGNRKEAMNFIKKQVKSEEYAKLLPQ